MLDNEKFIRKLYTYAEGRGLDTEKFVSMFSDEGLEGGKIISFDCYNLPSVMLRQLGEENMRLS